MLAHIFGRLIFSGGKCFLSVSPNQYLFFCLSVKHPALVGNKTVN